MPVHRSLASVALASLALAALVGCSSSDGSGSQMGAMSPGGAAGQGAASAGAAAGAGAGADGTAGSTPGGGGTQAQGGASGAPSAGTGGTSGGASGGASGGTSGAPSGGAAPSAGAAGMGGDPDAAGDTPPTHKLNVSVGGMKQITHQVGGSSAGLDTRTTQIGKLAIDLGVTSGGYQPWLGKRGYHVMGVSFPMCGNINDWALGRGYDGDCRLNTFDGLPHGTQSAVVAANSISAHVKANLQALQQQFPTEDWSYFLNADGSVRWSDVAFTGMSHGATTAAVIGKAVRLWRVVSRSGPRDNTCGNGASTADFSAATPPWKATCPDTNVASWLDAPSATPIDRFYSLSGKQDVEWGDIMFAMERMKYSGTPVRWDLPASVIAGNRLYADDGHLDFLSAAKVPARTNEALNLAFGVPVANQNPTF